MRFFEMMTDSPSKADGVQLPPGSRPREPEPVFFLPSYSSTLLSVSQTFPSGALADLRLDAPRVSFRLLLMVQPPCSKFRGSPPRDRSSSDFSRLMPVTLHTSPRRLPTPDIAARRP